MRGQILAIREQVPDLEWLLALESGEMPTRRIARTSLAGVSIRWPRCCRHSSAESVDARVDDVGQPLQIIYTSGTTGDPKGIVGDHMRFGGTGMLGGIFGYARRRAALHGALLHA